MAMRYYAPFPGGSGEPLRPRGPNALRIGDAERDAAAADLGEHYAAGRLSLDELNERLDAVFSAKTFGQLAWIMDDLPGRGRLPWRAGSATQGDPIRPGPHNGWEPISFPDDGPFGPDGTPWGVANSSMAGFQSRRPQQTPTPSDRAGRFAALSLLLLAMLIWLFTALLFARHGIYHQGVGPYPSGPFNHFSQQAPGLTNGTVFGHGPHAMHASPIP
ncbi:MAG TPA: DUF1707 domain-containing protein [Trebonia sp.]